MSWNSFLQDAVGVRVATPERAVEGAIGHYPTGGLNAGVFVDLERREEGTMRTRFVFLFIGVLVILGAGALTLPTPAAAEGQKVPLGGLACPRVNPSPFVVHCDKILFKPKGNVLIQCPSGSVEPYGELALNDTFSVFGKADRLDIKVRDNPQKVADIREKVARFLIDSNCTAWKGANQVDIVKQQFAIIDVEYVVIPPQSIDMIPKMCSFWEAICNSPGYTGTVCEEYAHICDGIATQ